MNIVILQGHLGQPIELKEAGDTAKATMNIATSRSVKKGDSWDKETTWHRVVVFGKQATWLSINAVVGSSLLIHGRISNYEYIDKQTNEKKYLREVVAETVKLLSNPNEGKSNNDDRFN
jgi:single-strand DNA-binding protein